MENTINTDYVGQVKKYKGLLKYILLPIVYLFSRFQRKNTSATVNKAQKTWFELFLLSIRKQLLQYKYTFVSSFCFGLLTYVFVFTNKFINHDEVVSMFAKGAGLSSGRWALDWMHYIFPNFSMPWIYGVISITLVSFSSCIIVHMFDIRHKSIQILLAGLIISFPSLIGTFSYMFASASYMLSFFLAVFSAMLLTNKNWILKMIAVSLLAFSVGIYQSYIAVTASLLILFLLKRTILKNEKIDILIRDAIIYFVGLLLSLGIYYLILNALLSFTGAEFNSYAGASFVSAESSLFDKIFSAYRAFFDEVVDRRFGLVSTRFSQLVHIVLFLCSGVLFLIKWIKCNFLNKLFSTLLIVLLPLSINSIFIVSNSSAVHTLVLYSFIAVYICFAILIDSTNINTDKVKAIPQRISKEIISWGMLLIIITNVYIANTAYLRMYLQYENTYSFYTSVMTQVKSTPGFDESSKIALVGNAGNSLRYYNDFDNFSAEITGTWGISANAYSRREFIVNFVGVDLPFASDYEVEEVKKTYEFSQMPIYPYYGSIKKIGDLIVVKLQ